MAREIVQLVRGAELLEVGRRRDQHAPRRRQSPGNETRVREDADPYGDVHAFLDGIDEAIVQRQLDAKTRIVCHEFCDERAEPLRSEGDGRIELEHTFGLVVKARDIEFGFFDPGQKIDAAFEVSAPASVVLRRRVVRSSSLAPRSCSNSITALLTAERVRPRVRPASA